MDLILIYKNLKNIPDDVNKEIYKVLFSDCMDEIKFVHNNEGRFTLKCKRTKKHFYSFNNSTKLRDLDTFTLIHSETSFNALRDTKTFVRYYELMTQYTIHTDVYDKFSFSWAESYLISLEDMASYVYSQQLEEEEEMFNTDEEEEDDTEDTEEDSEED